MALSPSELNRCIARYKRVTGPERDRIFRKIESSVKYLVYSYVKKLSLHPGLRGCGVETDDIYAYLISLLVFRKVKVAGQTETIIAPGALEAFSPDSGVRFTTFYATWMWKYGRSFVSRQKRLIHIPVHAQKDSLSLPMVTHVFSDSALDKGYFGTDGDGYLRGTVTTDTRESSEMVTEVLTAHQVLASMPPSQAKNILDYASGMTYDEVAAQNGCSRAWVQACQVRAQKQWQRIESKRI